MAFSTIRRILRANDVTVVGSASLSPQARAHLARPDRVLMCVNGAISSIDKRPDLWLLNSRNYGDPIYRNVELWPPDRQALHETMMSQASNRRARHLLFILKNDTPDETIAKLHALNVRWRASSAIHAGIRMDLARKAGVNKFATAANVSAGLFGACLALSCNASSVTLVGFSFEQDYAYLTHTPPDTRKHIPQDTEALENLFAKHGDRLQIIA